MKIQILCHCPSCVTDIPLMALISDPERKKQTEKTIKPRRCRSCYALNQPSSDWVTKPLPFLCIHSVTHPLKAHIHNHPESLTCLMTHHSQTRSQRTITQPNPETKQTDPTENNKESKDKAARLTENWYPLP